jgi:chorismate dehydratase
MSVTSQQDARLRIAAIDFLNPAPLMWDFEHTPLAAELGLRYRIDRMTPSECAQRLVTGRADLGLIPIAALPAHPHLCILPGCTIGSKGHIRSLVLVRRASQPLASIRSVAADTASRTTVTYARMLFHKWGNGQVPFLPLAADLDRMLAEADAAIVIGDPALLALEDQPARQARTGEQLVYHDMADEWRALTGLPFISAVWCTSIACSGPLEHATASLETVAEDCIRSRDHGLANIESLVREWSARLPIPAATIRTYLSTNIHYILDQQCIDGMKGFYRTATELGILPAYDVKL